VTTAIGLLGQPRPWLAPLGALFGGAAALRADLYRRGLLARERLSAPVISIGNLAVGGRGKTPLVERTAAILHEAGRAVAVLSRGYGGSFRAEALVVSNGERVLVGADVAGDEPVMLARALPGVMVAVGRDRVRLGRFVEERLGPRVHVLDDGFQHLRLERDLDIVCVDAEDLRARPLPAGILRERLSALDRADLVAVSGEDEASAAAAERALVARIGADRVIRVRRQPAGFVDVTGDAAVPPERAFLLSGIARSERFARDVAAEGVAVVGHAAFPDHHRFRPEELAEAQRQALAARADAIVTTAKDAVRLPLSPSVPVLVFRVRCALDDEARFRERLLAAASPR
jgi:tetraacyldisaccharide 4'-kinase